MNDVVMLPTVIPRSTPVLFSFPPGGGVLMFIIFKFRVAPKEESYKKKCQGSEVTTA